MQTAGFILLLYDAHVSNIWNLIQHCQSHTEEKIWDFFYRFASSGWVLPFAIEIAIQSACSNEIYAAAAANHSIVLESDAIVKCHS